MRHLKTTLAVLGAVTILVLAGNTIALATTGHSFILGTTNNANAITSLTRTTSGSALSITTKSTSNAPFAVNGRGVVANLNADMVDGRHNFNDLYYTKAEVASLIAAKVAAAKPDWARVTANGTAYSYSAKILQVTHPATGVYCIVVANRNAVNAAVLTLAYPSSVDIISSGTGYGSLCNPLFTATQEPVPVYINTTAGVPVDGDFAVMVPSS